MHDHSRRVGSIPDKNTVWQSQWSPHRKESYYFFLYPRASPPLQGCSSLFKGSKKVKTMHGPFPLTIKVQKWSTDNNDRLLSWICVCLWEDIWPSRARMSGKSGSEISLAFKHNASPTSVSFSAGFHWSRLGPQFSTWDLWAWLGQIEMWDGGFTGSLLNLLLASLPYACWPTGEGGESSHTLQGDKREIRNPLIKRVWAQL